MFDIRFKPYLTKETALTEHGVKYIVLKEDTPKELLEEYMQMVALQDKDVAEGKFPRQF